MEAYICGHGNKLMYNFHMVRALELNTDIGYIPEKSNKTGNGIEKILLQKYPSWKVINQEEF